MLCRTTNLIPLLSNSLHRSTIRYSRTLFPSRNINRRGSPYCTEKPKEQLEEAATKTVQSESTSRATTDVNVPKEPIQKVETNLQEKVTDNPSNLSSSATQEQPKPQERRIPFFYRPRTHTSQQQQETPIIEPPKQEDKANLRKKRFDKLEIPWLSSEILDDPNLIHSYKQWGVERKFNPNIS
jgi:hypothetical protein